MKFIKNLSLLILLLLSNLVLAQYTYAHMMVAQHGTLNVIDDGVFMVLSLPVSAFEGVDDDKDGKLSDLEFAKHRPEIVKSIHNKVVLKDKSGKLTLQGMILAPVSSHHSAKMPSPQLIVMGKFILVHPNSVLQYQVELFGKKAVEKSLEITVTRKNGDRKQVIQLSPNKSNALLFVE